MHGLIFETSICYWQDQPDNYSHYDLAWGKGRRADHNPPAVTSFQHNPWPARVRQLTSSKSVGRLFTTAKTTRNILARIVKSTRAPYSYQVYCPANARQPWTLYRWLNDHGERIDPITPLPVWNEQFAGLLPFLQRAQTSTQERVTTYGRSRAGPPAHSHFTRAGELSLDAWNWLFYKNIRAHIFIIVQ